MSLDRRGRQSELEGRPLCPMHDRLRAVCRSVLQRQLKSFKSRLVKLDRWHYPPKRNRQPLGKSSCDGAGIIPRHLGCGRDRAIGAERRSEQRDSHNRAGFAHGNDY